jgi:LmbE family N-acetylglucosaminyl deacetylase
LSGGVQGARRALVVSPHLDDAAFSCGDAIAGLEDAVVVTIFAGRPAACDPVTPWDSSCGFVAEDDVVGRRRAEDSRAMAILGARTVWLEFLDAQYRGRASSAEIARALRDTVARCEADAVFAPLGLFHDDHRIAHEAAMRALDSCGDEVRGYVYEDAIYRAVGELRSRRLAELAERGLRLVPIEGESTPAGERKRLAIECYASQLRGLARVNPDAHADALRPEHFWQVER